MNDSSFAHRTTARRRVRALLLAAFAFAGLFTTACTHSVHFPQHSAYSAQTSFAAPLTIVVPDDAYEVYEIAKMGTPLDRMDYRIYYGEALAAESAARFRLMFSEIAVVTETVYELAADLPLTPPEDPKERKLWQESLADRKESVETQPNHVFENTGYTMRFDRMAFSFANDRPLFVAYVEVTDRATGAKIMEGRIRGSGRSVPRRQAVTLMEDDIREAVVDALTQMTLNLSRDLGEVMKGGAPAGP